MNHSHQELPCVVLQHALLAASNPGLDVACIYPAFLKTSRSKIDANAVMMLPNGLRQWLKRNLKRTVRTPKPTVVVHVLLVELSLNLLQGRGRLHPPDGARDTFIAVSWR